MGCSQSEQEVTLNASQPINVGEHNQEARGSAQQAQASQGAARPRARQPAQTSTQAPAASRIQFL